MILNSQISTIFRDIEAELGTTALSRIVLESISESLKSFRAKNIDDFFDQFKELLFVVKNTKPRIGLIIFYFCEIWDELENQKNKLKKVDDAYKLINKTVKKLKKEMDEDIEKVIELGINCINDGDKILIHSHSKTVLSIIQIAKSKKINFSVILAEQENEKTLDMVRFLQDNNIEFIVVPEFMLSHVEDQITKVFLGGLTLNNKYHFVTDAGTNSVVAEFHEAHIPIYIFLLSKKYSLWETKEEHSTYKVKQIKSCLNLKKILTYERIKFSHDRVKVTAVDYIITEEGKFSPDKIKLNFDKKFKERLEWQKRHGLSSLSETT